MLAGLLLGIVHGRGLDREAQVKIATPLGSQATVPREFLGGASAVVFFKAASRLAEMPRSFMH